MAQNVEKLSKDEKYWNQVFRIFDSFFIRELKVIKMIFHCLPAFPEVSIIRQESFALYL